MVSCSTTSQLSLLYIINIGNCEIGKTFNVLVLFNIFKLKLVESVTLGVALSLNCNINEHTTPWHYKAKENGRINPKLLQSDDSNCKNCWIRTSKRKGYVEISNASYKPHFRNTLTACTVKSAEVLRIWMLTITVMS